jgi:hypothetical protein
MKIQLVEEKLLEDLISMFLLKNTLCNPYDIKQTGLMIIDVYAKGYMWSKEYTKIVKEKIVDKFSELQ